MNPQPIDDLHRTQRPEQSTTDGLFEGSDTKHDVERFKVGLLRLVANYQHPPIDRRTQIQTVCVVAVAAVLPFVGPPLLRMWLWPGKVPFLIDSLLLNPLLWLFVMSPALLHGWWKLGGQRRERQLLRELAAAQSPLDDETRIEIRGRPSELLRFAEIRDEMFEPLIFESSHTVLGMPLQIRLMMCLMFLALAGSVLVRSGLQQYWWAGASLLVFAYFVIRGIPRPPSYYRFVPRRLDFFVFSWMRSNGPIEVVQFDLREACIRIDLTSRKHMIRLAPPGDDLDDPYRQANILEFRRDNTPSPLEFSIALVRAALSTATPPPLPMDALTG